MRILLQSLAALLLLTTVVQAQGKQAGKTDVTITDPAEAGPDYAIQGEYVSADGDRQQARHGAQIVALGGGKFDLVLYTGGLPGVGWERGDQKRTASGETRGDATTFTGDGWGARLQDQLLAIHEGTDRVVAKLKKTERKSPTLGLQPPEGALVLFDGTSADHFQRGELVDGKWLAANCESKAEFGDHSLHLEFRTPFKPFARGQARGNSGVYLQSRYELQVLDSFGLEGRNNECGGIYSIAEPTVNACLPPLTWQTYDIDFTAARYVDGKKVKNARTTIRHNGILIHDSLELPKGTPGKHPEGPGPLPLYLQGHGNPVVYRNIWVLERETAVAATSDTDVIAVAQAETDSAGQLQKPADDGFRSIFDGKSLENWDGNPKFWRVEDGAITGQTTADNPTRGNTFLIWRGGEVGDFELKLQYRIENGNSGIQYRSFEVEDAKWVVGGYQADFEAGTRFSGILYGERFRGILADRGQKTVIGPNHKPKVVGSVGDSDEIQSKIKSEQWNDYHIIARGFHFTHKINGVVTAECTDEDTEMRRSKGILAVQLHAGPPMKVQFRNIQLKQLDPTQPAKPIETKDTEAKATEATTSDAPKRIALIAGRPSHGYGAHEHRAGCMLLAKALNESDLNVQAEVYTDGWPKDPSVLDQADSIVIYADGGGGHPFLKHLDEIDAFMKKGVGLVCLHYAVEVPKGEPGERFLDWTGGYFETFWSVNPHWTAEYDALPKHEITRGVQPFTINDEWYYHMRFRPEMSGVTPILTAVPPESTLNRKDGAHSNNPHVRAEKGMPQHMAWAAERPDGGRGFGFTGGHFHWNWGHDDFRKLVLNAIAWTAHVPVPQNGIPVHPVTVADLEANQDYEPSGNYNPARIRKLLQEWNRR